MMDCTVRLYLFGCYLFYGIDLYNRFLLCCGCCLFPETDCIFPSERYETKPYHTVVSTRAERKKKNFPLERCFPPRCYSPLRRGEFLLHPDWPSTIPHHRIP